MVMMMARGLEAPILEPTPKPEEEGADVYNVDDVDDDDNVDDVDDDDNHDVSAAANDVVDGDDDGRD